MRLFQTNHFSLFPSQIQTDLAGRISWCLVVTASSYCIARFYCIEVWTGQYLEIDAFWPPKLIWKDVKGNRSTKSWKHFRSGQQWQPLVQYPDHSHSDRGHPLPRMKLPHHGAHNVGFGIQGSQNFLSVYTPRSQASKTTAIKLFAFQQYTTEVLIPTSCTYMSAFSN